MKRKGEAYSGRVKNALGVAGVGLEDLADLKTDLDDAAGEESVAESSGEEASSVDSGVVSADAGSAFGAASIGIADGSTLKRSPGLNRTFGLFITCPFTFTFLCTTICLACHTLGAKHALKIKTSNLLSTSPNNSVPTGALESLSFLVLSLSSSFLPPCLTLPATQDAKSRVEDADVEAEGSWMEDNDSGRYQRSNFFVPM